MTTLSDDGEGELTSIWLSSFNRRRFVVIRELLAQNEGKSLEFKENFSPVQRILRTAVAFANFDEQPCTEVNSEAVDFRVASEFFSNVSRTITPTVSRSLNLLVDHAGREFPSRGAVLLFGKEK